MARLVVITGPVFSNKTRALNEIIETAKNNKPVLLVRSKDGKAEVFDGSTTFLVDSIAEVEKLIEERGVRVLGFDDCHLFRHDFLDWIDETLERMKNIPIAIITAGLDLDWQRRPFGPMADLMARADAITKLAGKCEKCQSQNGPARFTQKKGGSPRQVEPGGPELYAPACRVCHIIPILIPSVAEQEP